MPTNTHGYPINCQIVRRFIPACAVLQSGPSSGTAGRSQHSAPFLERVEPAQISFIRAGPRTLSPLCLVPTDRSSGASTPARWTFMLVSSVRSRAGPSRHEGLTLLEEQWASPERGPWPSRRAGPVFVRALHAELWLFFPGKRMDRQTKLRQSVTDAPDSGIPPR